MLELTHSLDPAEAMKQMRTAKGESARRRWQVLYLAAQTGVLKPELGKATKRVHAAWIAKQTGYSASRVGQIVREFNCKGLEMFDEGLRKRPNAGRPGALNEDWKRVLVSYLSETKEEVPLENICAFIQKEFGVEISKSTARRYRKGFKDWKLPPPPKPEPPVESPARPKQKAGSTKPGKTSPQQKPKAPSPRISEEQKLWPFDDEPPKKKKR